MPRGDTLVNSFLMKYDTEIVLRKRHAGEMRLSALSQLQCSKSTGVAKDSLAVFLKVQTARRSLLLNKVSIVCEKKDKRLFYLFIFLYVKILSTIYQH